MLAQSVVEYGGAGSIGSSLQSLTYSVTTWLAGISASTWVIVVVVLAGAFVLSRRSR